MIIEIAANNFNSAWHAYQGGAHRIELVSNLLEGGVTPSLGTLQQCINEIPIPTYPIIRARGGDFLYNASEVATMCYDIEAFQNIGCKGIVIGALTSDAAIDMKINKQFVKAAKGMDITFHRAFDRTKNAIESIQKIIELGCSRILTSGQMQDAFIGKENIKYWITEFKNQISFMPGAGITIENAKEIAKYVSCQEIHSSMKTTIYSNMQYFSQNFNKESYLATGQENVRSLVAALGNNE